VERASAEVIGQQRYLLILDDVWNEEQPKWENDLMPLLCSSIGAPGSIILVPCRSLSVRKVVLTLTSDSAEIGLSMAGAKQHNDTRFILIPAAGRTSGRGVLVALYCDAPWCS
jgi:hypothetical protein